MRGSVQALMVCGALVGGLAGSVSVVPAQAARAGSACTASWTGLAGDGNWDDAQNWSPKMMPTSSSDVCITQVLRAIVTVQSDVSVHSLTLSLGATVEVAAPRFTVTGALRGAEGEVLLDTSTLTAGSIDVGNVSSGGNSVITSPRFGISLLVVLDGMTALTDAPTNLSGTTFTGGGIEVPNGVLRIPGDIHTLDGLLLTAPDGVQDDSGHNALAHLSAIGTIGSLRLLSGTLTVTGDLTNWGSVDLGGGSPEYGETGGTLAVQGTFTQMQGSSTSLANHLSMLQAASIEIGAGSTIDSHEGTLSGPVINDGVLDASIAKVNGSYAQRADGVLEMPETSGATALAVQGTAMLGGTLAIDTFAAPNPGSSFTVMSFTSVTGAFSTTPLGLVLKTEGTSLVAIAPQLAVTPKSNARGGTEHFSVAGFEAGETVFIHLDGTGSPSSASVRIPTDGLASGTFSVPASAVIGKHQVVAVGGSSHRLARTAFEIT